MRTSTSLREIPAAKKQKCGQLFVCLFTSFFSKLFARLLDSFLVYSCNSLFSWIFFAQADEREQKARDYMRAEVGQIFTKQSCSKRPQKNELTSMGSNFDILLSPAQISAGLGRFENQESQHPRQCEEIRRDAAQVRTIKQPSPISLQMRLPAAAMRVLSRQGLN